MKVAYLSDQIDAKLSEEGGNICQAEGYLSVGPYNGKDISPACISRTARAETNSRAKRLAGGGESDRYGNLK